MSEATHERLHAGLDELIARVGGAVADLRAHAGKLEIVVVGGEPVWVEPREGVITIEFAGWIETFALEGDDPDDDDGYALALDFVAAALFGELRVTLGERGGEIVQRKLEVRVEDRWRLHASGGRRGLAGWLGRVRDRVITNRVPRPKSLRACTATGQPHAPWAGAGGFAWVPAGHDAAPLVIDGELDLHDFPPREVAALVREYIEQCRARGIRDLRIVHGKGIGALRRTVHALLAEHPDVEHWRLGGHGEGSWGATIVRLRP